MQQDLPSNSRNKGRLEKPEAETDQDGPRVEKVVTGGVTQRKKSLWRRSKELFFGGESKGVLEYVFADVMVPAAQDLIADAAESAIRGAVYGQPNGGPRRTRRGGTSGGWSYGGTNSSNNYHNKFKDPRSRDLSPRARATHDIGEYVLESRVEAEEILDQMYTLLERYEQVTVYDLYGLMGVSAAYTDQKWGWTSLQGSDIRRERGGGYVLSLPRTESLK